MPGICMASGRYRTWARAWLSAQVPDLGSDYSLDLHCRPAGRIPRLHFGGGGLMPAESEDESEKKGVGKPAHEGPFKVNKPKRMFCFLPMDGHLSNGDIRSTNLATSRAVSTRALGFGHLCPS